MPWQPSQLGELAGRAFVVTGANSGIGLEAGRALVERGAHVVAETTLQQLLNPSPYDGKQVYRNTKQANLLFAQELHRRCRKAGSPVSAVAVHPGASATNLFARQLERAGHGGLARASKVATSVLLQSPAAGARSTLRALDGSTPSGSFVGPARFAQLRGRPELLDVYPSATDPATRARLWERTEQALGRRLPV